jgi:hypothetical protein
MMISPRSIARLSVWLLAFYWIPINVAAADIDDDPAGISLWNSDQPIGSMLP